MPHKLLRKSSRHLPFPYIVMAVAVVLAPAPASAQLRDEPQTNQRPKTAPDNDRLPPRAQEPRNKSPDMGTTGKDGKRSDAPPPKRAEKPAPNNQADSGPLDHRGPGGIIETPAKSPAKRALGAVIPDAPIERAKLLRDLYAHLATAHDEQAAAPFVEAIERLWLTPGSDTVMALMERALHAASHERPDLALNLLDAVINIAPDYAEGFNRRAYVFYTLGDRERALGDLRRVLALDPSHFKAIDGFAQIMKDFGDKKAAFVAYQKLISIHPFWPSAQSAHDELKKEVEGQGL
jgi:tetratricopeptide (TPR) repeat protein